MLRAVLAAAVLLSAQPASAHEWAGWFEYGRTELSARGYQVAAEVADYARRVELRRIVITGHMDTAEAVEFSDELSRRRAQAMAMEIVRLGVRPDIIELRGNGAGTLARPTPGGVQEPLNRRVIVDAHR
ncbi:OmpA family protein [Brevundimonas sp. GCM10030266]|uniref:OmpA family protein n=1 Tax=Brevundimonas sp. GCM10030266 TaxID=3273386 RepID=UPI0036120553